MSGMSQVVTVRVSCPNDGPAIDFFYARILSSTTSDLGEVELCPELQRKKFQ